MSADIKRFDLYQSEMEEDPEGEFVRWEDYRRLLELMAELGIEPTNE